MMAIFAATGAVVGAEAEAGTGALGMAALLAWARAVAPKPDARMQTNVNERFMRSTTPSLLLIESPAL